MFLQPQMSLDNHVFTHKPLLKQRPLFYLQTTTTTTTNTILKFTHTKRMQHDVELAREDVTDTCKVMISNLLSSYARHKCAFLISLGRGMFELNSKGSRGKIKS